MSRDNFIPYGRHSIDPSDIEACVKSLKGDFISRGPLVAEFEKKIADYCGARFGVAFNSGTSALQASYFAAEICRYDRLFTSPNTFAGTIVGALNLEVTPTFIDIDRKTGNIDLHSLAYNLNQPSSRGRDFIVPVHFSGIPVDMEMIGSLISDPQTIVIEDAAHALGSSYKNGVKVGSCFWSHMTVFSFHPNKNITTGEGGMVMTNDENLYNRLLLFRNNGIERHEDRISQPLTPWYYEVQEATGNFNLTEFQAAIGLSQLSRLDNMVARRRNLVERYRTQLSHRNHISLFDSSYDKETAYHLFVAQINFQALGKSRQTVMEKLFDAGIGSQVHFIPLYRHPFISRKSGDIAEYFPEMESYYQQALSLPLHCEMDEGGVDYIVETLLKILKN
jgi:dTDP-4-amino-4,6-dideoxygalactose transaminase